MAVAFRILPLTMAMATLTLGVKVTDIVQGSTALSDTLLVSQATAETEPAPGKKEEPKKEEAKKEDGAKAEEAKKESPKKEPGTPTKPSAVSQTAPDTVKMGPQNFTQSEVDILQNLSKRREELERWAGELEMKENVLTATEQRIDQKLGNMQELKKQVDALLVSYNRQEDAKIKSLVKIYENMKPVQAARIFEETDMPVLLLVIDKMSERKVAPVLAAMDPKKAQKITAELAAQRRVQPILNADPVAGAPSAASASPAPFPASISTDASPTSPKSASPTADATSKSAEKTDAAAETPTKEGATPETKKSAQ